MPRELVLVGGGQAHVQVIRRFAMEPSPGVRMTVVLDRPEAVYSGMVPGFVAGEVAAFVGVRQVGPRTTVWCSSMGELSPSELEEAVAVCRALSMESPRLLRQQG